MRITLLAGLMIPALISSAAPLRSAQVDRLTTGADIIKMHKGGLKDETILDFLRTYRASVVLKGQDVADMAAAGLSDGFIQQLLAYVKAQPAEPQDTRPKTPSGSSTTPSDGLRPRPNNDTIPPYVASDPYPYDYPTTSFYVSYPYDYWAFPLWYTGLYAPFGGYRYGYGHYGGGFMGRGWGGHIGRPGVGRPMRLLDGMAHGRGPDRYVDLARPMYRSWPGCWRRNSWD
jgi:hypothetical protein